MKKTIKHLLQELAQDRAKIKLLSTCTSLAKQSMPTSKLEFMWNVNLSCLTFNTCLSVRSLILNFVACSHTIALYSVLTISPGAYRLDSALADHITVSYCQ